MQYKQFSDADIQALVQSIDREGYAVLPNWVSREQLAELQAMVGHQIEKAGNNYVALSGHQAVAGTPLYDMGASPVFLDLCKRIVQGSTGRTPSDPSMYQVLRCLTGEGGRRESMIFHYDSYVLTTIMPVCMPTEGETGELVLKPNHRRLRRHYMFNLLDKLRIDNRWAQRRFHHELEHSPYKFTRLNMQPGNLYLFWGYRTLHTNKPVSPDAIRATAVFHYENQHGASSLAGRLRNALALRKSDKAKPSMA